jgi:hypothetical protein
LEANRGISGEESAPNRLSYSTAELNGVRGNTEQGMYPVCNKEGWSHILRCEETRSWREELVDKRFTNIELEIGMSLDS